MEPGPSKGIRIIKLQKNIDSPQVLSAANPRARTGVRQAHAVDRTRLESKDKTSGARSRVQPQTEIRRAGEAEEVLGERGKAAEETV